MKRVIGTIPGTQREVEVGDRLRIDDQPITVMGIETNHILVSFENIQQYGTGTRRWLSHDHFAFKAERYAHVPNTNPWPA